MAASNSVHVDNEIIALLKRINYTAKDDTKSGLLSMLSKFATRHSSVSTKQLADITQCVADFLEVNVEHGDYELECGVADFLTLVGCIVEGFDA